MTARLKSASGRAGSMSMARSVAARAEQRAWISPSLVSSFATARSFHTVADAVEHPQVQARNMIVAADGLRMAGNPVKVSGFPDPPTRRPAPDLDADGARIRGELSTGARR